MQGAQQTTARRAVAVLKARQHLVAFAIALYALDSAAPLAAAWTVRHRPFATLLDQALTPLAEAVARVSVTAAALSVLHLVLTTWLRAGYLRSLAGSLHLGPRDARQFGRLLGLQLLIAIVGAAAAGIATLRGGEDPAIAALLAVTLVPMTLAVLYADFAIVLGDDGPVAGIVASLRIVRRHLALSVTVTISVILAAGASAQLLTQESTGSLARALPVLVIQCVVMGAVTFVADVVLLVVFQAFREGDRDTA